MNGFSARDRDRGWRRARVHGRGDRLGCMHGMNGKLPCPWLVIVHQR